MTDFGHPTDGSIDDWEADLLRRYPAPGAASEHPFVATVPDKPQEAFRDYDVQARPSVKEFYRLNHRYQTYEFVRQKRVEYLPLQKRRMSVWEALEFLNTLVDDSDHDTDVSQIEHLMQTAEAIRRDGHPRWFVLTGLIHDLGKILCLFGEPQWAVVGDTVTTTSDHTVRWGMWPRQSSRPAVLLPLRRRLRLRLSRLLRSCSPAELA